MQYHNLLDEQKLIEVPEIVGTAPQHIPTFILQVLNEVRQESELRVFARSASTWAEQFHEIAREIDKKNIHVRVVVAADGAVMATAEDHGKHDVASSVSKLRSIQLSPDCRGSFRLYRNPTHLLFSYVMWETATESYGLLTLGAGLDKSEQMSILIRTPSLLKARLDTIYSNVLSGSTLDFEITAKGLSTGSENLLIRKPRIFIGSSAERINLAFAIQSTLQHEGHVTVWSQGIFRPSRTALDSLTTALDDYDFAVFVFAPDDLIQIRDTMQSSVRDNVLIELALFIAHLGKTRTFIVAPQGARDLRIPTDLLGVTSLTYDETHPSVESAVGPVCFEIQKAMRDLGIVRRKI